MGPDAMIRFVQVEFLMMVILTGEVVLHCSFGFYLIIIDVEHLVGTY